MNHIKIVYTPSQVPFMELDYIKKQNILTSEIIVVVPEQFAFDAEKYLIKNMQSKGLFNVRVYGFKKLLYEFSHLVGLNSSEILSEFGKTLAMMQILEKIDDRLEIYRSSYRSKLYVELIIAQLDALRTEEINDKDLYEISQDLKLIEPILSKKISELSIILSEYLAYFENEKIDEIELSIRLKEYFISNNKDKILGDYDLIVDLFTGMGATETSLITAMASRAENSFIRILHAKTGLAARYSYRFISQVKSSFKSINQNFTIEEISMPPKQAESNALVFQSLFDYENRTLNTKSNFDIIRCKNKDEEITYIAQDILSKMKTEKYLWTDFAIFSSNIELYDYNIDKIFQKYKIPYFRDENISVTAYDFIMFIVSSLRAVSNNFSDKNVIETIKHSAFFTMDETDFKNNYSLATDIERYVLSMNINYDSWFRNSAFKFIGVDKGDNYKNNIIKFKNKILYALKELRDDFKKQSKLIAKSNSLRTYLNKFNYEKLIEEKINYYTDIEDEDNIKKFMAIQKAYDDVFEQVELFAGDIKLKTEQFVDLFISALSVYKAGITPPATLKVLSGSLERTKFIGIKQAYIVGANDGLLPSSKFSSKSIFTSAEVSCLDNISSYDFKTVSKFMDKEVFDLYEKIILAKEKVSFTYSITNDKMEEISESNWIKNLKKICGIKEIEYESNLNNISSSGVKNPFYESVFLHTKPYIINKYKFDKDFEREFLSYLNAELNLKPSLQYNTIEYAKKVSKFKNNNGINKYQLSVSRLEKQALCPYGFFVEYALKPKKNNYEKNDYLIIGNIYHRALEYFVNDYINSEDKVIFKKESEKMLKDCFLRSQAEEEILNINTELKDRLKFFNPSIKYVSRSIINQIESSDKCKINSYTEKAFNHNLKKDDKELRIEGIIDRLDIILHEGKKYLRIVDYKTGIKEFKESEIKKGLQLQLLTYLKAILETEYKDYHILGAFYHSIRESFSDSCEILTTDTDEGIDKEVLKNYRLSGRYINEERLLKDLDYDLNTYGESISSNLKLTSRGSLNNRIGTLIDKVKFDELFEIAENKIWDLLDEIQSANIGVKNHDTKEYPCPYCSYRGILKLDKMKYRHLFLEENN